MLADILKIPFCCKINLRNTMWGRVGSHWQSPDRTLWNTKPFTNIWVYGMHTKIDKYSDHSFIIYSTGSLLPAIAMFIWPTFLFGGIACCRYLFLPYLGMAQCTFTITEAQHMIYRCNMYPITLWCHCCCVPRNIKYMRNVLYTLRTR